MATRTPEIPLDQRLLDLLSSKTRRRILFTLQERPHTVSELSEELDLSKPTVHEHLDKLEGEGLVERREDERLWVYYELTGRGEELITPSSGSRLRVVVGVAVAALVAGAFLASALPAPSFPGGGDEGPPDEAHLLPDLENETVLNRAGEPLGLENLTRYERGLQAYLVPADEAGALLDRSPRTVRVIPLDVRRTDGNVSLHLPEGTPGGTYRLYLESAGETNLLRMPTVRVEPAVAHLDPATWWKGLDGPVRLRLPEGPLPAGGRVLLTPAGDPEGTAATAPLADRRATFGVPALEGLPPGNYTVTVVTDDGSVELHTTLAVRDPSLAVAPRHQAPTSSPSVQATLDDEVPDRLTPPAVRVDGSEADLRRTLGNAWTVPLPPGSGRSQLQVGRLASVDVDVHPPVSWRLEDRGGHWRLTLERSTGEPVEGAVVLVDGEAKDVTNEFGNATFVEPPTGRHVLRVEAPGGATAVQPLSVEADGVTPLEPTRNFAVQDVEAGPQAWRIDVYVGTAQPEAHAGPATVAVLDGGRLVGAAPIPADHEGPFQATVTAAGRETPGEDLHVEVQVPTPPFHDLATSQGTDARPTLEAGPLRNRSTVVAASAPVDTPASPPWRAAPPADEGPWEQIRTGGDAGEGFGPGGGVPGPGALAAAVALAAAARALTRGRKES